MKNKVPKKLEQRILQELGFIIGIVSEGLGSQYKVYIKTDIKVKLKPLKE